MYHVVWANLKKKDFCLFVIETVKSFEINS